MNIFSVLTMLGGLAMFLFGMNVMGNGLEKLSGGKLERVLERLTSNPMKGVLFGAAVTAVIQSSSAVTVMVVGFVNSGIMKLYQAVGIIMGANVGTTVTSWILSLTGIEGDSFILQMLKPTSFSPILALIGVGFMMMSKSQKKKDIGNILLGFAVLMFGMTTMSDAVKPLADVPEFTNILTRFSNPILGLLTGALLTAVIQSSSASVGILQALCVTGAISYQMAIPIILGQNIGTCVTALISSIGTNTNAKRTSMVHLYFNIIGAGVFMAIFMVAKAVFKMEFLTESIGVAGVATVHTIFNVVSTVALLPFGKVLEKLAILTVKDKNLSQTATEELQPNVGELIEDRFLISPAYALEKCRDMTLDMADMARDNVLLAMQFIHQYDEKLRDQIDKNEETIDSYEDNLETYLMKISSLELAPGDSREMSKLHHAIGNFERIADYGINLLKTKKIMHKKKTAFTPTAQAELKVMENAVKEIIELSLTAYKNTDVELAKRVEPLEQVIDGLKDELRVRHVNRFESGECTIEQGFAFLDIISSFERISDHCSNIAVSIIELSRNSYQTHEYLSAVKANNNRFREYYNDYLFKYNLD